MIRKRIAVLLAMLIFCFEVLSVDYHVEADGNITTYELNENVKFIYDSINNKLEISGSGSAYVKDISTVIGDNYESVKEVVVDEGITELPLFVKYSYHSDGPIRPIPDDVILYEGCPKLEKVTLPSTIDKIPGGAFFDCSSLKEVQGLQNITQIGQYAFYGTSIKSVSFGDSLWFIGKQAFANCAQLVSVEIGNGLQSVYEGAFLNCSNIETFKVESMEDYSELIGAFEGCDKLYDSNGCLSVSDVLVEVKEPDGVNTLTVTEGIREIASRSMAYLHNYKKVVLPSTLEKIDKEAFIGADIESVELPSNIKKIGDMAFVYCYQLENVDFKIDKTICDIGLDIFDSCLKLADEKGSVIINGLMLGDIDDGYYDKDSGEYVRNIVNITQDVTEIFLCLKGSDIKIADGQTNFVLDNGSLYTYDYDTLVYAKVDRSQDDKRIFNVKSGCKKIAYGALSGATYNCEITIPYSVTDIYSGNDFEGSNIVIKGTVNSYANQYADKYGYEFAETELNIFQGDSDRNGTVNLLDAKVVLRAALGITDCTNGLLASSDIDLDGKVTLLDAKAVLKAALGISQLGSVKDVVDGTLYTFPDIETKDIMDIDKTMWWYPMIKRVAPSTGDLSANKESLIIIMFVAVVAGCSVNRKKRRIHKII